MSESILKYFLKASKLLEDARFMLDNGIYDGAVNRAYYAMFNSICAALFVHGVFTKSHSGAHAKFREFYLKNGQLPLELNQMLSAVFELRQEADYDFEILKDKAVASQAVEYAHHFCGAVRELLEKNN